MNSFIGGIIHAIADVRKEVYNPVFLCGISTQTAAALKQLESEYCKEHPNAKINHICGEQFTSSLVLAVKNDSLEEYRSSLADCDLLIFKGVEHIGGKTMTMVEFYGLFDKLWESGKQIVLSGTVLPKEIPELDERIRTQLEGGIICKI